MSSLTERTARETPPGGENREHMSTAALVKQATEQISRLIRDELRLLRAEMNAKGKRLAVGAGLLGGAAVLALYAVGVLIAAAVLGLAVVWPAWLSALVIGAGLLLLAGLFALVGRSRIKKATPPMPAETTASLKADIDEIRVRAFHEHDNGQNAVQDDVGAIRR